MMRLKQDLIRLFFIIRKDIEEAFPEKRLEIELKKSCQSLGIESCLCVSGIEKYPIQCRISRPGEQNHGGAGHAVLACKQILQEPFAVVNADDYYGKEAFVKNS